MASGEDVPFQATASAACAARKRVRDLDRKLQNRPETRSLNSRAETLIATGRFVRIGSEVYLTSGTFAQQGIKEQGIEVIRTQRVARP
jgi:hypothetical protein